MSEVPLYWPPLLWSAVATPLSLVGLVELVTCCLVDTPLVRAQVLSLQVLRRSLSLNLFLEA